MGYICMVCDDPRTACCVEAAKLRDVVTQLTKERDDARKELAALQARMGPVLTAVDATIESLDRILAKIGGKS